jgi:hypothetical protein
VRVVLFVVGLLVALGGVVWILQGFNVSFAPKSFMTNDRSWVVYGTLAVIAGGILSWWARSRN